MTKEALIRKTIQTISKLPHHKVEEIADYAEFLLKRFDEDLIQQGIHTLVSESESFQFLHEEEELYTIKDLKEKF